MKKYVRYILVISVIVAFGLASLGSGSSSDSETDSSKVGEITTEEKTVAEKEDKTEAPEETSEEHTTTAAEKEVDSKSEYFVGETYSGDAVEITFLSSGDYIEENEFMQPEEGSKYVFMKFFCKNVSDDLDTTVGIYDFNGFADGYAVEQYYGADESLSATLSPGRSCTGVIVLTVPVDASEIELEYEVNLFTDEKIKFIYEGVKDSGIVPENDTSASEDAYHVNDVIETDQMRITYLSCGEYVSDNMFIQPDEGMKYIYLELEFENISDSDQIVSSFYFNCYADGANCEQEYATDTESLDSTLSAGRKCKGKVVFEVPISASVIEVEYDLSVWVSKKVIFSYE